MSNAPAAAFGQILNGGPNRMAIDIQIGPNVTSSDYLTLRLTTVDAQSHAIVNTDYPMDFAYQAAGGHFIAIDSTFYDFFDIMNVYYYNIEVGATMLGSRAASLVAARILDNGQVIDTVGDPSSGTPLMAGNTTLTRNNYFFAAPGSYSADDYSTTAYADYGNFDHFSLTIPSNGITPTVSSIHVVGATHGTSPTTSFEVTFSTPVHGVTTSSFVLNNPAGGSGAVSAVHTTDNMTWTVDVTGLAGAGTHELALASNSGISSRYATSLPAQPAAVADYVVDSAGPAFSIANAPTVTEGDNLLFTVTGTGAAGQDTVVHTDHGDVTILSGQTSGTLQVLTADDHLYGSHAPAVTVTLTGVTGDGSIDLALSSATGSTTDAEVAPVYSIADAPTVTEGGNLAFAVNATVAAAQDATVHTDHGDVTIEAGATSGTLLVQTTDDHIYGSHAPAVTVALTGVAGDGSLDPLHSNASGNTTDAETAPVYSIANAPTVTEGSSLVFTVAGTVAAATDAVVHTDHGDVTIRAGQTSGTLQVQTADDQFYGSHAPDVAVTLTGVDGSGNLDPLRSTAHGSTSDAETAPVYSIADAPTVVEGGNLAFAVNATIAAAQDAIVHTDHGDLTVRAGQVSGTLLVQTADDHVFGSHAPGVTVTLTGVDGGGGLDPLHSSGSGSTTDAETAPVYSIANAPTVPEGNTLAFAVTATVAAAQDVTVHTDYGDATVSAGDNSGTLLVQTRDNATFGPNPSITVSLLSASLGSIDPAASHATGAVSDNEPHPPRNDFNGDGVSDLMFRNTLGAFTDWEMAGGTFSSGHDQGAAPVDWQNAGSGDFNGDHTADILLRSAATGRVLIWNMHAGSHTGTQNLHTASHDWDLVGTGDFDGDGIDDVLFHNNQSGQILDWNVVNGVYAGDNSIGGIGSDWTVLGTGDFNGDGTSDILFYNTQSGWLYQWEMAGGQIAASKAVGWLPSDWAFRGLGDFDGDRTTDILLQNTTSGLLVDWQVQNGTLLASHDLGLPTPDWTVAGIGDFDGGGTDDILFRHSSGVYYDWQIQNGAYVAGYVVASASDGWHLVS